MTEPVEQAVKLNKAGDTRGMTEKERANLSPNPDWKPGVSGNPGGSSLKAKLQDAMDKPQVELGKDATVAELIVQATIEGAINREPTPFREVWDRTEGKLTDTPIIQDNRVVNIIVSSERAKQLTEGVEDFDMFNQEEER